ncbi:MAG: hypothetical protein KDH94_08120, partial [Coxiellaceae bacterium]|nr:hypothetical protein [Coxiellaceae bacterium]
VCGVMDFIYQRRLVQHNNYKFSEQDQNKLNREAKACQESFNDYYIHDQKQRQSLSAKQVPVQRKRMHHSMPSFHRLPEQHYDQGASFRTSP